jgi:threonine/homoserine/homoserine lactone efflux protein
MFEIFQMFILGFVIGLTSALAPGPTLVATINASIAGDWTIGLKVSPGSFYGRAVVCRYRMINSGFNRCIQRQRDGF